MNACTSLMNQHFANNQTEIFINQMPIFFGLEKEQKSQLKLMSIIFQG